ncbi:U3 snoRNA-associated small subunit rRNA processing protein, putative [Plasmodium relictum]|uniref:U3 snoRNA-associated small subunit rRNA processing protein, putative n=1 Tax=Plasmodium relictum TaxID=85471 RepID=A0A1J1H795_PLARL|nr:U3 snoRNA-associated small subunit rRNA processing protein, putative [Plasmodium relictum]CRH00784.1 U3 snoRNA-associated small subunit rRNA processing protein, putative [Plasmodium relictum]
MGVEKNICMPLKLSDVFHEEKIKNGDCNDKNLDKVKKEENKKNSKSILNKYKITEFNKNGIQKIQKKKKFHNENMKNENLNLSDKEPKLEIENDSDNNNTETNNEYHLSDLNKIKKRKSHNQSNLLIANGTTGLVVHNGIMCLSIKGIQPFIITSIKKSFCVYDPHKLRKAYASEYFSEDIKNLYCDNGYVYVIFNKKVYRINEYGKKKIFYNYHKYNIVNILTVSNYLLTYSKKEIIIWNDRYNENDSLVSDSNDELSDENEKKNQKEKGDEDNISDDFNDNYDSSGDGDNTYSQNETDNGNVVYTDEEKKLRKKKYNLKNNEKYYKDILVKSIELFDNNSDIEIKSIIHPVGYINKVIICTNENKLYLYNINKEKIIHEFSSIKKLNLSEQKHIKILSKTLVNEEISIITSTNELYIINIEKDEIVYSKNIYMDNDFVSCVNFYNYKYNDETNLAILIGTESGKILMINSKNSQYFIKRDVHDYIKNILISPQGYIYTSGYDNKINLLNLNKSSFTLEIIKKRNSCIGAINNIKYLDDENYKLIVSANMPNKKEGNLFIISPHNPEQNKDFSWNKKINILNKKIIDFDININRHYDWNNILICLENSDRVYLASSYKKTVSNEYLLLPFDIMNKEEKEIEENMIKKENEKNNLGEVDTSLNEDYRIYDDYKTYENFHIKKKKHATSVLISSCGHVGVVGYSDGEIHSFNIQSTTYRNEYKLNKYSLKSKAHKDGDILKLYLYGVNYFVSASNSKEDTFLRVWDMYTCDLIYSYNIKNEYNNITEDISIISYYHHNILTAVCLSNNYTLILDIEQKCITRKFHFSFPVTNIIFSKDNRLIFFALSNNTLLIYEIISHTFIDYLLFKNDIVAMEYNDIYLYTAHKNSFNFLYCFTNKNLFNNCNYLINDYKMFNAIPIEEFSDSNEEFHYNTTNIKELINMNDDINDMDDTLLLNEKGNNDLLNKNEKSDYKDLMKSYTSKENQINKNLLTMSGFNISKIAYLIFLDKIKENCRVEENIKKNEEIPFFLSAKLNNDIEYTDNDEKKFLENITNNDFDNNEEKKENNNEQIVKSKHITKSNGIQVHSSKLQEILAKNEDSYINVLKYLKSLSPSGVHYNILCLSTKKELENMMNFFIYHVKSNDNIDLIQAYILIFLKVHGKKLMKTKEQTLRNTISALLQETQRSWSNINFLFENIIFFIKFLTNIQLE